jgi:folate-binding protein YgfZ
MSHRAEEPCRIASLTDRGLVRVAGPDAKGFLQGLVTNDMDKTHEGGAIHAGLLTPQGKILFDFFVVPDVEALAKRLSFYKLRADVAITEEPTLSVAAAWGASPSLPDQAIAFADPRLEALGIRMILPEGAALPGADCASANEADYHAHRIRLGVPDGGRDYAYNEAFPHEALYDQLHGVDFEKGCYVGQEVVSRMQHRGTARKRVVHVEGDGPLEPGADIEAGTLPVGRIGSVNGARGLALLRLDRVASANAKGTPTQAGGTMITVRLPDFATFELPSAEGA